jgi:hypothetical protein
LRKPKQAAHRYNVNQQDENKCAEKLAALLEFPRGQLDPNWSAFHS